MPQRIQRKRTKGWKMPPNTVYVGRPTVWGNMWTAGGMVNEGLAMDWSPDIESWFGLSAGTPIVDANHAVAMYRTWIDDCKQRGVPLDIGRLRGKNLACWCALDQPCHADVLLELANK